MIRVNLVGKKKSGGAIGSGIRSTSGAGGSVENDLKQIQRQGLTKIALILLLPIGLYFVTEYQMKPEKKQKIANKQRQINDLRAKNDKAKTMVDEIKKIKQEKAQIQKQISIIEGLRADRQKEVKVLYAFQKDIPEKVWLDKLEFKNDKVLVYGLAAQDTDANQFLNLLSANALFKEVGFNDLKERKTEQGTFKEFTFNCQIMHEDDKPSDDKPADKTTGGANAQ